jgi:hypothetical protein
MGHVLIASLSRNLPEGTKENHEEPQDSRFLGQNSKAPPPNTVVPAGLVTSYAILVVHTRDAFPSDN